ncbi:MAG: response regulator transcription factor [Lachnospiraceae bacterium]|nr:response regulator transcription factor [Lachnospiraceae bacterium]
MDRILIADDDAEIRSLLRLYLEKEGLAVAEAADGPEALKKAAGGDVDLCLLDIMMPGLDGFHVLQELRKVSNIPVIIISAKDADPEKILGLDLGADDYMVKPFNPLEAVARVRSNLRRYHTLRGGAAEPSSGRTLQLRDLVLDLDAAVLQKGTDTIELTSVEYRILELFMSHPGKVFTKQQIFERAWGEAYVVSDNNIMVAISKLRAKLDDDPGAYIKTIRGLGYRMA